MKSTIDPKNLDGSVRPTDDFFRFVNAKWAKDNPIPPEESKWGSFYTLRLDVEKQLKELLEELDRTDDAELDATGRKVRDFYRTGMDAAKLARLGDEPLADLLALIDGIKDRKELARVTGLFHRRGISAWWSSGSEPDAKQSDVVALYIGQSGLSLPDRDYYLKSGAADAEIRTKFLGYAEGLLGRSSRASANGGVVMKDVMELETRLAEASMTRVELRDMEKQYNKKTIAELQALAPAIDWQAYFDGIEKAMPAYAIVCQPKFFEEVNRQFESVPLEDLKKYLRWHALNGLVNFLGEDFEKRAFDFYGRTFGGATEMKPQWRRVLGTVNAMLDQGVGILYVERHFGEEAKRKIRSLVEHLTAAYRARIGKLDWMGDETKKKALAKLDAITLKLGFPDEWKDLSALDIGTESYAENYMRAHAFEFDWHLKQVGHSPDRTEWYMPPQMVNACYHPLFNEILFPAAILQPPFFDPEADDAVNFGAIGAVIGHELTHGFDDQGAQIDLKGNLKNWWTKEDKERFDKAAEHLAAQADRYEPLPGLHLNGKLTLGENIADMGGLLIAFDGLSLALKNDPKTREPIDGLDPYKRFFISFAVSERGVVREEALRLQIQTDPHSPGEYRVNGTLSNLPEFYEAFGCKPGDKLWREPDDRVRIW